MRILPYLLFVSISWSSLSLALPDELAGLPMVDSTLEKKLDQHSAALARRVDKIHATRLQKHGVWQFDWLPGYYVKYNVSRVIKRELVAQCIKEYNLDLLHTPKKYLYHLKGRPWDLDSRNYVVVAEKVRAASSSRGRMNREQIRQFITLIEQTGHLSTYEQNFLRLPNKRLSFIDTDGTFKKKRLLSGIIRLLQRRSLESYYTPDALEYLLDSIARHIASKVPEKRTHAYSLIDRYAGAQSSRVKNHVKTRLRTLIKNYDTGDL